MNHVAGETDFIRVYQHHTALLLSHIIVISGEANVYSSSEHT